jgi:PIN domain nuclease of toxin-antitoxin system
VADWFVSEIVRHRLLAMDQHRALQAAVLSADHQLPMADALIYAVARDQNAELITTDTHFKDLPRVTIL